MTQYTINEDPNQKSKEEEEKEENEELNFEEFVFINFNPKSKKILDELENDDSSFNEEIESILAKLGESSDLSQVQSEILLLITKKLKIIKKKDKSLAAEIDEKKSKNIQRHILDLSQYLINQRSQKARSETKGLDKPKDRYQYLSPESVKNLKSVIKRFIVYELYKIINPHQIAGETRKETFIHNVILRGLEVAKHYEGGTEGEIRAYGTKLLNNLQNKNRSFKGRNTIIR